jgi:hypothetical protein
MKKLGLISGAIICCALFTSIVAAQSDKVAIPVMPRPNQTTRLTVTHEYIMEAGSVKMTMKTIMGLVQKSGPADDQGRFNVEIICEDSSVEMPVGDTSLLVNEEEKRKKLNDEMKKIIGKKFTTTYDGDGRVLDVEAASDLDTLTESFNPIRELMYSNIPKGDMIIGATAVSPLNVDAMVGMVEKKGTFKFQGDMKSRLVAVINDAGRRVAKFDQTFEAASPPKEEKPKSGPGVSREDLKVSGAGTLEINLDKSLLNAYVMKMDITSVLSVAFSDTGPLRPILTRRLTINVSVSVKN